MMRAFLFLFFFLSLLDSSGQSVDWKWTTPSSGSFFNTTRAIKCDDSNQVLMALQVLDTTSLTVFGKNIGPFTRISSASASLVLMHLGPDSNLVWQVRLDQEKITNTNDRLRAIDLTFYDNAYYLLTTGTGAVNYRFNNQLKDSFDFSSYSSKAMIVLWKFSKSGELLWHRKVFPSANIPSSALLSALQSLGYNTPNHSIGFAVSSGSTRAVDTIYFEETSNQYVGIPCNTNFVSCATGGFNMLPYYQPNGNLDTLLPLTRPLSMADGVNQGGIGFPLAIFGNTSSVCPDTMVFAGNVIRKLEYLSLETKSGYQFDGIFRQPSATTAARRATMHFGPKYSIAEFNPSGVNAAIKSDTVIALKEGIAYKLDTSEFLLFDQAHRLVLRKKVVDCSGLDSISFDVFVSKLTAKNSFFYGNLINYKNIDQTVLIDGISYTIEARTIYRVLLKLDDRLNVLFLRLSGSPLGIPLAEGVQCIDVDPNENIYLALQVSANTSVVYFGDTLPSKSFSYRALVKIRNQSITRGEVFPGPYCAGDSLLIPYAATGVYEDSNSFIAQMSDEDGSFEDTSKIIELGRLNTTQSDTIVGSLPEFKVNTSANYRIRIISTFPPVQSFFVFDTLKLLIFSRDTADLGNDTLICKGNTVQLSTFGGSAWDWKNDSTFVSQNRGKASVRPLLSRFYEVEISDSSGCGQPDSDSIFIEVRDQLEITGDTVYRLCKGDLLSPLTFSQGGDSSQRYLHYEWDSLGIWKAFEGITFRPPFSSQGRIILADSCSIEEDTLFIRFVVDTTFGILFQADTLLCYGQSSTIKVGANGCKGPYSYRWQDDTTNLSDSLVVQPLQTRWYSVEVTDSLSGLSLKDSIRIQVLEPLSITLPNDTVLCYNNLLSVIAFGDGGDESYHYTWSLDRAGLSILDTTSALTRHYLTTQSVYLRLDDGCSLPVYDSILVTVYDAPSSNLVYDTVACYGQELEFVPAASGQFPLQYDWKMNGSSVSSDSFFFYTSLQNDSLELEIRDRCSDTVMVLKAAWNTLAPLKVVLPNDTLLCLDEPITILANASGGRLSRLYTWRSDLNYSSISDSSILLTDHREDTVFVKLEDGCSLPDSGLMFIRYESRPGLAPLVADTFCQKEEFSIAINPQNGRMPWRSFIAGSERTSFDTLLAGTSSSFIDLPVRIVDACNSIFDTTLRRNIRSELDKTYSIWFDSLCVGETQTIEYLGPEEVNLRWLLDGSSYTENPLQIVPEQAGSYPITLYLEDPFACKDTVSLLAYEVIALPVSEFDFELAEYQAGDTIRFLNRSMGATQWIWSFDFDYDTVFQPEPRLIDLAGDYRIGLQVANSFGCTSSTSKVLSVSEAIWYYVPTSFSPDGNGLNDVWGIEGSGLASVSLKLYNRWGQLVWEADDITDRWDGEAGAQEVFLWVLQVRDIKGNLIADNGSLYLLR